MMVRSQMVAGWLFTLVSIVAAWDDVSRETLEKSIGENGWTMVAFISPSEPKSKAFEQEWHAASEETQASLLSFNCEENPETCKDHGVEAYPTLVLYHGSDTKTRYLGPRRATGIKNFVSRLQRPVVTEVTENVKAFRVIDETVFVAYIDSNDAAAAQAFKDVAERYREEFTFGLVTDPEVIENENVKSPTVVCHIPGDGDTRPLTAFSDPDALERFVIEASRPIIGEMMPYNQQRFLDRGWPMIYIFAETEQERARLRMSLAKFARGYYDSLTSVTVDPLEFPDLPAKMGLEPGAFPAGAVHQLSKDRVYPYHKGKPLDSKSLQQFGLDVWQGRIKPWTPPGVTTSYTDIGPTHVASRKVSIRSIPGMNIRIAGHDEL